MGSNGGSSLSLFCGATFLSVSSPGDRGGFPACPGGWGARYLTLPGSAGCGGVVGLTGCTPVGMGGAGALKDLGLGEIVGLKGSPGDVVGLTEAEGTAVKGKVAV